MHYYASFVVINYIYQLWTTYFLDFGYMGGGYTHSPMPAMPNPAHLGSMLQQPVVQVTNNLLKYIYNSSMYYR